MASNVIYVLTDWTQRIHVVKNHREFTVCGKRFYTGRDAHTSNALPPSTRYDDFCIEGCIRDCPYCGAVIGAWRIMQQHIKARHGIRPMVMTGV